MTTNTYQKSITPVKPHILKEERVNVYVPTVTYDSPGIASFENRDFIVNNAKVSLSWSKQLEIEQLTNPLTSISEVKLLDTEFEHTGNDAQIINPVTGVTYKSNTAEIKLKRSGRDATIRPDLIKVSLHDFDLITQDNGEILHKIKVNDAFSEPSLIQIDRYDFVRKNDGRITVYWPYAHNASGTQNTNGYGLVKIAPNSANYLEYVDGLLAVDDTKLFTKSNLAKVRPIYTGTRDTGFTDIDTYIDSEGFAKRNAQNNLLLSITKNAVGLSNVANRSFNTWRYNEFGPEMQQHFTNEFSTKLDRTTWNNLFSDWAPSTNDERTPELRFDKLTQMHNAQQEQINTLLEIKSFLGYFETYEDLIARYTPSEDLVGCSAYVFSTNSYWSVRKLAIGYEWYDTYIAEKKFADYIETDPKNLRANGEPSVGSSGRWIQSDHIHPVDTTRLAKSIYKDTNVTIKSQFGQLSENQNDFTFNFWNEDTNSIYDGNIKVNIPYVRKAQTLHNWAGEYGEFHDSIESSYKTWIGSKEDYNREVDTLDTNSLIFVDDEYELVSDVFTTDEEMYKAGLLLDTQNQFEKIVTTDEESATDLIGSQLTLSVEVREDGQKVYKLRRYQEAQYLSNRMLTTDETGHIATTNYEFDHNVMACMSNFQNRRLIIGYNDGVNGVSNPLVSDYNSGNVIYNPIVSDGNGGVTQFTNYNTKCTSALMTVDGKGSIKGSDIYHRNVLITADSVNPVALNRGEVLIVKNIGTNEVTTFNTGTENRLIVADGSGAFKQSNIPANRLLYTSSKGTPAAFAMDIKDAGKVLSVDTNGNPTLSSIAIPTSLPISALTEMPTIENLEGYKLVLLDLEPKTKLSGYIYCW